MEDPQRKAVVLDLVRRFLGPGSYVWDYNGHGAVYQDARPGEGMPYTRIGWQSDQSPPSSDIWPGMAITVHLATSPANGFLRVAPREPHARHRACPSGSRKSPAKRGLLQPGRCHSDLWPSAARATDDPPLRVRRQLRAGSWGRRLWARRGAPALQQERPTAKVPSRAGRWRLQTTRPRRRKTVAAGPIQGGDDGAG